MDAGLTCTSELAQGAGSACCESNGDSVVVGAPGGELPCCFSLEATPDDDDACFDLIASCLAREVWATNGADLTRSFSCGREPCAEGESEK